MNLQKNFTTLEPGTYRNSSRRTVVVETSEIVQERVGPTQTREINKWRGYMLKPNGDHDTMQYFESNGSLWDAHHRGCSSVFDLVEFVRPAASAAA